MNPLGKSAPILEAQPGSERMVASIPIDKLAPFKDHPFRPCQGEQLDGLVQSIKANGVLVPIVVRPKRGGMHEILAAHNRVSGAKLAGRGEIPGIVLTGISEDDAMAYVVETNLLQRSFSDMAHSEKAAVIALHHSKMFSQGKRNDILEQTKRLENPRGCAVAGTYAQVGHRLKSRDIGERRLQRRHEKGQHAAAAVNARKAGQRQHAQNPVRRRIAPKASQGPGNQAKQNCVRKTLQANPVDEGGPKDNRKSLGDVL